MFRTLIPGLPAVLMLAACTPPPDSATRTGAEGLRVELTAPRTCLDKQCLLFDDRLGRVQQPERESVPLPEEMVDADGFISATDFRELLRRTRMADPMEVGLTRLLTQPRTPTG